jgi:hypothetical protein
VEWTTFWTAVGAVGTCVSAVVILVTVWFLARQVRQADSSVQLLVKQVSEAENASKLNAYLNLQGWLQAEEYRQARRDLHQIRQAKPTPDTWTADEIRTAEQACIPFEMVGHMVELGLVPLALVDQWQAPAQRTWHAVKDYVDKRRLNESRPEFWGCFERFASNALQSSATEH